MATPEPPPWHTLSPHEQAQVWQQHYYQQQLADMHQRQQTRADVGFGLRYFFVYAPLAILAIVTVLLMILAGLDLI